jgi:predicted phosphodiesterase
MLSKEIKQLIELSGGKIIISEGDITDSYVVMKLEKHLQELERIPQQNDSEKANKILKEEVLAKKESSGNGLTRDELLDRINTDIAEMKKMNVEKEIAESFELESEKGRDEKKGEKEFYYEKVH